MKGFSEIIRILPDTIVRYIDKTVNNMEMIQEIRIRIGQPIIILCNMKELIILEYIVTEDNVRQIMNNISAFSLYAYEEQIRNGFITVKGGHRIGLAGEAVVEAGKIKSLRYISSINIRIAHEIIGCSNDVIMKLYKANGFDNTIIIAPPGRGKTTLLRDMIRNLSNGYNSMKGYKVSVIDQRSEIAACYRGIPQNNLGIRTDVIDNVSKKDGMVMAIRTMSPEIVAIDELGGTEDIDALIWAGYCGCKFIATIHGYGMEDICNRYNFSKLLNEGMLKHSIILSREGNTGNIKTMR